MKKFSAIIAERDDALSLASAKSFVIFNQKLIEMNAKLNLTKLVEAHAIEGRVAGRFISPIVSHLVG